MRKPRMTMIGRVCVLVLAFLATVWTPALIAQQKVLQKGGEQTYVITLQPDVASAGDVAADLAKVYGGTAEQTPDETEGVFRMRLTRARARVLAADPRVASVTATAVLQPNAVTEATSWSAGITYTYDGSGNVHKIGNDTFSYDHTSRVITANVNGTPRDYSYDAFGNRTGCRQWAGTSSQAECQKSKTIDAVENRNRLKDVPYDGAGNVKELDGHQYAYDSLNLMKSDSVGTAAREFVYTANDERIAVYNVGSSWRWAIRGGTNEPSPTALKYTGHERDSWGSLFGALDYMHARYYDLELGRFASVDPFISRAVLGLPQGWNRYSYALNNPLRFTDPTGKKVDCTTIPATDKKPEQVVCSEVIDVEGETPTFPTIGGSIATMMDLTRWMRGGLPRISAADPRSAQDLANTPVMDQIRAQYKKNNCDDRKEPYYGDFQYSEFMTTPPLSTGQAVGSFGAKIRGIGNGLIVVTAFNTWGLESGTRFPGTGNRHNASVQQMLGGAPIQYPKSLLENRSSGPMSTATLNCIWIEGSPCMQ